MLQQANKNRMRHPGPNGSSNGIGNWRRETTAAAKRYEFFVKIINSNKIREQISKQTANFVYPTTSSLSCIDRLMCLRICRQLFSTIGVIQDETYYCLSPKPILSSLVFRRFLILFLIHRSWYSGRVDHCNKFHFGKGQLTLNTFWTRFNANVNPNHTEKKPLVQMCIICIHSSPIFTKQCNALLKPLPLYIVIVIVSLCSPIARRSN